MAKQDDYVKTAFRLPKAIHFALQESAEDKGRSMNAEIIDRLTNSFIPIGVVDGVLKEFDVGSAESGWRNQDEANSKREEAIYALLVKVADMLSSDEIKAEDERNLLAEVVRLMAKLRDKYYWHRN